MIENVLRWVGGKHTLAPFIIQKMPEHSTYVEVFAGALHVYWQKPLSEYNIVNDINKNLVNLYMVIKHKDKLGKMLREMNDMFYGRDLFNELRDMYRRGDLSFVPDYQRAALYLYLNRASFNGMFSSFAPKEESKMDLDYVINVTQMMWRKLNYGRGTVVENQSFKELIPRFDSPGVFMYLDPPYWVTATSKGAGYYEFVMTKDDHVELMNILSKLLHAKFLMSYDDVPEVRELYKDGYFRKINTPSVNQSSANRQTGQLGQSTIYKSELLIANYDIEFINQLEFTQ